MYLHKMRIYIFEKCILFIKLQCLKANLQYGFHLHMFGTMKVLQCCFQTVAFFDLVPLIQGNYLFTFPEIVWIIILSFYFHFFVLFSYYSLKIFECHYMVVNRMKLFSFYWMYMINPAQRRKIKAYPGFLRLPSFSHENILDGAVQQHKLLLIFFSCYSFTTAKCLY